MPDTPNRPTFDEGAADPALASGRPASPDAGPVAGPDAPPNAPPDAPPNASRDVAHGGGFLGRAFGLGGGGAPAVPSRMAAIVRRGRGTGADVSTRMPQVMAPHARLARLAVPRPQQGQALIRVRLAAVNRSDFLDMLGVYGAPRLADQPLGFEGMGEVVDAVGPQARALIGARVSFISSSGAGSWAQYVATDSALCLPVRDDIGDEDAAVLQLTPLTAMALFETVRAAGAHAAVITAGASQTARLVLDLARGAGVVVIAMARRPDQAARLERLDGVEVVDISRPDWLTRFADAAARLQPRLLLDAVGDQPVADAFAAMPRGARWISYGTLSEEPPKLMRMGDMIYMGKRIEGFWLARWLREAPTQTRGRMAAEVQARFADGRWRGEVETVLTLEEAMDRLPITVAETRGRVLIRP